MSIHGGFNSRPNINTIREFVSLKSSRFFHHFFLTSKKRIDTLQTLLDFTQVPTHRFKRADHILQGSRPLQWVPSGAWMICLEMGSPKWIKWCLGLDGDFLGNFLVEKNCYNLNFLPNSGWDTQFLQSMTGLVFMRSRYRANWSILDDFVTYIHQLHPNPATKTIIYFSPLRNQTINCWT